MNSENTQFIRSSAPRNSARWHFNWACRRAFLTAALIGMGISSARSQTGTVWPHVYGVIPSFCVESPTAGVPAVSTSIDRAIEAPAPTAAVFIPSVGTRVPLPQSILFMELRDSPDCRQILRSLGVSNLEIGPPTMPDLPVLNTSEPRPYCEVPVTSSVCGAAPNTGFAAASNEVTGTGELEALANTIRTTGQFPETLPSGVGILFSRDRPGIYTSRTTPHSLYVCIRQPGDSDPPSLIRQIFGGRRGSRECGQWVGLFRTELNVPSVPPPVAQDFLQYPEIAGVSASLTDPIRQEMDRYSRRLTTLGIDLNDPAAEIFREWRGRFAPEGQAATQAIPILDALVHLLKDKEIEMLWDRDRDFTADAATWWSTRRLLLTLSCSNDLTQVIPGREFYVREQYRAQVCRREVMKRAYGRIQDAFLRRQAISESSPGLHQVLQIGSRLERLGVEVLQIRSLSAELRHPYLGDFTASSRGLGDFYPRPLFLQGLQRLARMLDLLAVENRVEQMASGLGPVPQRAQDREAIRNAWVEASRVADDFWDLAQNGAFTTTRRSDVLIPFASVWARVVFLLELPDSHLALGGPSLRERTDLAALNSWGAWIASGAVTQGSEQQLIDRIAQLLHAADQRNHRALGTLARAGLAHRGAEGVTRQYADRFRAVQISAPVSAHVRSTVQLLVARWVSRTQGQ